MGAQVVEDINDMLVVGCTMVRSRVSSSTVPLIFYYSINCAATLQLQMLAIVTGNAFFVYLGALFHNSDLISPKLEFYENTLAQMSSTCTPPRARKPQGGVWT